MGVELSPDGALLAEPGTDTVSVRDARTGEELRSFHLLGGTRRRPSMHGASASRSGSGEACRSSTRPDRGTRSAARCTSEAGVGVEALTFSPDGILAVGSSDGWTQLLRAETCEHLVSPITFTDGTWAAASRAGDGVTGIYWTSGFETIELSQLKAHFYEPGLVAKRLGLTAEPLRTPPSLGSLGLPPAVSTTEPAGATARVEIEVADRGSGIGDVIATLNGIDVTDHLPRLDRSERCVRLDLSLKALPYWRPGDNNAFEVRARTRAKRSPAQSPRRPDDEDQTRQRRRPGALARPGLGRMQRPTVADRMERFD